MIRDFEDVIVTGRRSDAATSTYDAGPGPPTLGYVSTYVTSLSYFVLIHKTRLKSSQVAFNWIVASAQSYNNGTIKYSVQYDVMSI